MRSLIKMAALAYGARAAWRHREQLRGLFAGHDDRPHVSAPGAAVDHERQPGVPPPDNDDYQDDRDVVGASSFPASDPPSTW